MLCVEVKCVTKPHLRLYSSNNLFLGWIGTSTLHWHSIYMMLSMFSRVLHELLLPDGGVGNQEQVVEGPLPCNSLMLLNSGIFLI